MSVEVDKRVVELQFDNKQFEKNVQTSLGTIDKLKMALDFDGAKGLDSITKAANKMDLSNVTREVDRVQVSFSALQVAGMTMVSELTKTFMNFGKNLWNMSLGQMKSGGMARTLKIEQAEFKLKALAKNILKVEEDAAELTAYVKKMSDAASNAVQGTAYGYDSAMATVSQLVASGINDAETMESYLKGIAGAAAMTGKSFDDIGNIFSTVASNGKLMTKQLRQFSYAGFNVAAVLANEMGKTEEQIGEMIEKGQISFEMFAETISKAYGGAAQKADDTFAGVTSNIRAQLSRVGQLFTDPYVKHMVPFLQKVKAAIKELREALVPTSERFDRFFKRLTEYAAVVVDQIDFSRLDTIVRGIENLLFGVAGILYTIYQAFRDVFDKRTVEELREMAFNFERLTESLLPSTEALAGVRTSFKFLFSLLKVGIKIVSALQKAMKPLVVYIFRILGSIIGLVRHLEPLANSIIKFIKESSLLEASMEIIAGIIETICNGIVILISILDSLFGDVVTISTFKRIGEVLVDISNIINSLIIVSLLAVYALTKKIVSLVDPEVFFNTINKIKNAFGYLFNLVIFGIDTIIESVHALLNSGTVIGDLLKSVKELFGLFSDIAQGKDLEERMANLKKALGDMGESMKTFIDDFKEQMRSIKLGKLLLIAFAVGAVMLIFSLQRLTEAMIKFTNTARNTINIGATINKAFNSFANYSPAAQTLITFAIAIAAVTSALVTLSQVEDKDKLLTAGKILGAFAAGLLVTAITLTLAYKYFMYTGQGGNVAHLAYVMIGIAAALMLLVVAVKAMANLTVDLKNLLGASAAVIGVMGGLAVSVGIMAKLAPEFQASMWSILSFAASTLILVKALDILRSFDIAAIWKQVVLIGGLMIAMGTAIGLASKAAKTSTMFTNNKAGTVSEYKRGSVGGSLLMFALSMKILLGVFQDLCAMPMTQLDSGIKRLRELMLGSFIPLFLSFAIINKISGSNGEFVADVSKLMMSMAMSMIVIFTAISLFSIIPAEDLDKAVNAMSSIMSAIGKMMTLIFLMPAVMTLITSIAQTKTDRKIKSGTYDLFTNLKGIILALAGLVVAVSLLCVVAKGMDADAMVNITYIMGLIAGLMVLTEFAASFAKGAKAAPILAALVIVISIVGAIAFLAATMTTGGLDVGTLAWISVSLAAVFAAVGIMLAGMGKYTKAKGAPSGPPEKSSPIIGMLTVMAILAGFVLIVKYGKDIKFGTAIAIFAGMFAVIGMMALLVLAIKKVRVQDYARLGESMKVILPAVALFATLVASFVALALVINKVSDDAWGKALATLGFISLFILGMGFILDKAGENAGVLDPDGLSGTMKTMGFTVAMISVLGLVMAAITAVPTSQGYVAKLVALGVIVAALIAFLKICDFGTISQSSSKKMMKFAEAFVVMCTGVIAIAAAIALVSTADFSEGSGIGWKLAALAVGVGAIAGMFLLLINKSKTMGYGQILASGAVMLAMSASTLLIAEAIKNIASISIVQLDTTKHVLGELLLAFGLLVVLCGAISAVPGIGEGFDLGLLALSVAMLSFGATLIMLAKSVKIFTEAVHELADMSADDIRQVTTNINTFLAQLPLINRKLEEFGPDLAKTIALWIQYIAMGFAMALGSLVSVGFTAVIAFLAGFLMALPAILDAVKIVLEVVANWIIENQDVIVNATKATFVAVLAAGKGMIDAFFEYYGVKLEDFLNSSEEQINARERNEEIARKSDDPRVQSLYKWYEDEKRLIDAGASEFGTYQDAANKVIDMAEGMYKDNLLTQQQIKDLVTDLTGLKNIDWDAYFKPLDIYKKMREQDKTINPVVPWIQGFRVLAGQSEEVEKDWQNLMTGMHNAVQSHSDSYATYLTRTDEEVDLAIKRAEREGKDVGEAFGEGFEAGFNKTSFADRISNGMQKQENQVNIPQMGFSGGSSMATNAANSIVKRLPGMNLLGGSNGKKLKEDIKPDATELGKEVVDGAVEGVKSETSNSKMSDYAKKALNTLQPYADMIGFDLGQFAQGGFLSGLSEFSLAGVNFPSLFGGNDDIKTADWWHEYGMQMVDVPGSGGAAKIERYRATKDVDGNYYKDIESYVRANSKYGEDWLSKITGFTDGLKENVEEIKNGFMPSLGDLTSGLEDAGDAAGYATDYTDRLKESIESSLDVFTAFNKEVKLTGREILANFYSQIDGVQTWQKELEELATRGMNKNFLNQLAEEGPRSYDQIHAFYTMTEAEMTLFNTMYAQKLMIQRNTANDIRKSFVATGNMMQDELDKFETSIGEQYDEKVSRAQAKAAKTKAGTIAESTQKSLDLMYQSIEEYEADSEFIDQWKDYIGSSTVKMDLANAFTQLGYTSIDAFAQSMNFQKVMEKILAFKKTVKEQVKSSLNLFDEVKEVEEKDKMTTTEILNNMEENLKRVGGWSNNLKKMIKMGFSEGLIEELRKMGPESAEKVEAFVKMTADEVSMANKYWGESVQLPESISNRLTDEYAKAGFEISLGLQKGLEEGSDDFYDKFRVAGENASRGYVDGIDADAANDTMRELGENTLFKIMEALDEHSPSRKMMEIGYNVVAGFMIGINDAKKGLWKTINVVSDEIVSKFETMGKYCADGLSNGLVKGTSNLGSVIGSVASKMANTFASVLKIESPSKVFYDFGKYIVMGLEKGLTDEEDPLIDTVVDTGDKIVDTMANKLYKLGSDPNLYYKTDRWAKYYPEPVYQMTTMTQVAANRNAYNNDNWSWSPGVKQDSGSMYGRYGTVRDPALDNPDADWKVDLATGFTYMKLNLDNVNSTMNNLSQKSEESKEMYKTTNEYIKTMTDSINRMSNDISSLGDRMSNMEVRLDGNALVGQIVAPMDKAMGRKVISQKRGRM